MKKLIFPLFFFLFQNLSAQWHKLNGPEGAGFICTEKFSFGILCGTDAGIFITTNEGLTWQKMPTAPQNTIDDILNINDTVIVVYLGPTVLSSTEVYSIRSYDQGVTWSSPTLIESSSGFNNYKMHHQGNYILMTGQYDSYISYDYGQGWTIINSPNIDRLSDVQYFGRYLIVQTVNYTTYHIEHFISADGSLNWQSIDTIPCSFINMLDSVIFECRADTANYFLARTFDFGQHWDTVFTSPVSTGLGIVIDNGILYRYDNQLNYYSSTDLGQTWNTSSIPHGITYTNTIPLTNGDEIAIVHNVGLVHYVSATDTFYTSCTGIVAQTSSLLRSYNNKLYLNGSSGFYSSTDAGITWNQINTGIGGIMNMIASGDTLLLVSSSFVARSIDNGATWDTVASPTYAFIDIPGIEILGSRIFYSGMDNYFSDDLGDTWSLMPAIPDTNAVCGTVSVQNGYFRKFRNELYIITNGGLIQKFDQGSNSWVNPFCFFSPGAHNGNYLYVLDTILVASCRLGLYYSSDGQNWTTAALTGAPLDQYGDPIVPHSLVTTNGLWIGSCGGTSIYASSDHGDTWFNIATPDFNPRNLAMQNDILYSGSTANGVWKRDGTFHTYSGKIYVDENVNSVYDAGDRTMSGIVITTIPSGWVISSDSSGNYSLTTDAIGEQLVPAQISGLVHMNPSEYILDTLQYSNLDFAIIKDTLVSDFAIDITNVTNFRPGQSSTLIATISNFGTLDQPGTAAVYFPPQMIQFTSSTPVPDHISNDTVYWNLDTLSFLQQYGIRIETFIPTSVHWLDTIYCYASTTPSVIDAVPDNNNDTLIAQVRNSFDPNDKTCLQGDYITTQAIANDQGLDYIIRFQNTGNAPAITVDVVDSLSYYTDWSTFRLIASSHTVNWNIDNRGVVHFDFGNIMLPDSNVDEPNSHGFVKYTVKLRDAVQSGNVVQNTAYIYFDFNPPVQTNTTTTLVIDQIILNVPVNTYETNLDVLVYPNPANSYVNIKVQGFDKKKFVRIYNTLGNVVAITEMQSNISQLSIENVAAGIYIGEIISDAGERLANFRMVVEK